MVGDVVDNFQKLFQSELPTTPNKYCRISAWTYHHILHSIIESVNYVFLGLSNYSPIFKKHSQFTTQKETSTDHGFSFPKNVKQCLLGRCCSFFTDENKETLELENEQLISSFLPKHDVYTRPIESDDDSKYKF